MSKEKNIYWSVFILILALLFLPNILTPRNNTEAGCVQLPQYELRVGGCGGGVQKGVQALSIDGTSYVSLCCIGTGC